MHVIKKTLADKKLYPISESDTKQQRYSRMKPKRYPKNESYEHYFCKMVGQLLLYRKFNCRYVGTEITVGKHNDILSSNQGRIVS